MSNTVILAYSGGLDTSVAVHWLKEKYDMDVITLTIDVGNEKDFNSVHENALKVGAIKALLRDAKELFIK
ncbi:MAG: argininosuccinate synthase, partial [Dehalococcoidia bacterium]|nr:argininosuccinate synthase [Dehalococcoidia bacterium]